MLVATVGEVVPINGVVEVAGRSFDILERKLNPEETTEDEM